MLLLTLRKITSLRNIRKSTTVLLLSRSQANRCRLLPIDGVCLIKPRFMSSEAKRLRSDNMTVKQIGTHNGTFHCDEALACFFLRLLPEYKVSEPRQMLLCVSSVCVVAQCVYCCPNLNHRLLLSIILQSCISSLYLHSVYWCRNTVCLVLGFNGPHVMLKHTKWGSCCTGRDGSHGRWTTSIIITV